MSQRILASLLASVLLLMSLRSFAVPGDQLYSEDFSGGLNGWVQTIGLEDGFGNPLTSGVNAAFGDNAAFVAGDAEVRVESPVIDLGTVSGARVTLKVTRGKSVVDMGTTLSNKPENGENWELEFLDSDGAWQTISTHAGGGTGGEEFFDVIDLPAGALHANFKLRAGTWGGDSWDGDPDDFWHFDDVIIIETGGAGGDLSACAISDDFEGGLANWNLAGNTALSSLTYKSASNSMILTAGGSTATSPVVDLAGKQGTVTAWIRAGGWPGGSDNPESSDYLDLDYQRSDGNWSSLHRFCTGCSNNSSRTQIDGGGVLLVSIDLPANAEHANARFRWENESGSSSSTSDAWHVDDFCVNAVSPMDHFAIKHDGSGVNCQAEFVELEAHAADHSLVLDYAGTVLLTTSTGHGNWALAVGTGTLTNFGSGIAQYAFSTADKGEVLLSLADTYVETISIGAVDDDSFTELSTEAPALSFAAAGFQFVSAGTNLPVGVQIAGKPSDTAPSNAVELQAIRTSDSTGACEAAFVGATPIELAMTCENPTSCAGTSGSINSNTIATSNAGTPASWTFLNLDFGDKTDSTAPLVFQYNDSGAIQLHARKTLSPSGAVMTGASNNITVRPFGFDLQADQGSLTATNPAATTLAGNAFERAGLPFRVTARAVRWQSMDDSNSDGIPDGHDDSDTTNNADLSDNAATANYGNETSAESVQLAASLVAPAGGNDPGLTGTTTLSSWSSGSSTSTNLVFAEAGSIEISADLADDDYLGGGNIIAASGAIGRFTPHHYDALLVEHGCNSDEGFGYSGQPFGELQIVARNVADGVVKNMDGGLGFAKAITISETTSAPGSISNASVAGSAFDAGVADIAATTSSPAFQFSSKLTAPTSISLRASDSDGISSAAGSEGGTEIRSGRLRLYPSRAPDIAPSLVSARVETYDGAQWQENEQDSCSALAVARISLDDFTSGLGVGETGAGTANGISAGLGVIRMSAPGVGNAGSATLHYDADSWLEFDWSGTGIEDPATTLEFMESTYPSEEGFIDRREVVD